MYSSTFIFAKKQYDDAFSTRSLGAFPVAKLAA
jgi:hypothetical protein